MGTSKNVVVLVQGLFIIHCEKKCLYVVIKSPDSRARLPGFVIPSSVALVRLFDCLVLQFPPRLEVILESIL